MVCRNELKILRVGDNFFVFVIENRNWCGEGCGLYIIKDVLMIWRLRR